jgi:LysM repeat protein
MYPFRPRRSMPRAQAVPSRPVSVSEAQQLMLPLVVALLLALLLAWPSQVRAQSAAGASVTASSTGTHTVRPGETLWSLAARYYGDGHKWRELASVNGLAAGGELGIAVGQVLRVPTLGTSLATARAAMAEAPPAATPSVAVTPAAADIEPPEVAEPTAVVEVPKAVEPAKAVEVPVVADAPKSVAPAAVAAAVPVADEPVERMPRIGIVRPSAFVAARGNDNTTIFLGPAPIDADTMTSTIWLNGEESFVAPATRRIGEFQAAPIPMGSAQWKSSGRVRARALASGGRSASEQQRMQSRDLIEVVLPTDVDTTPGAQFVTVSVGAELGRGVRLAIPTGVLTLEAPRHGVTLARVTRVYGVIEQGQAVLPYVEAPMAPVSGPVSAVEATVRWITDAPLLPSIQSYLVLAPADGAMLETGDRFELLSASAGGSRVGEARVVRVTADGATAIVTQQEQPAIRVGMRARRIGRAP